MVPLKISVPVPVLMTLPLAELSEITPLKLKAWPVVSIWKVPVSPDVMIKGIVLEAVDPVYSSVAFKVTLLLFPSGPLAYKQTAKLKVYAGEVHPHAAQKPIVLDV